MLYSYEAITMEQVKALARSHPSQLLLLFPGSEQCEPFASFLPQHKERQEGPRESPLAPAALSGQLQDTSPCRTTPCLPWCFPHRAYTGTLVLAKTSSCILSDDRNHDGMEVPITGRNRGDTRLGSQRHPDGTKGKQRAPPSLAHLGSLGFCFI